MNVEIGIEAAQFPGKEFINGIFLAEDTVWSEGRQMNNVHKKEKNPLSFQLWPT
jgi:hypothetical protein